VERLLREREAAQLLCVSVQLLRRWRASREGPPFLKIGKLVRYAASDLEEFARSRTLGSSVLGCSQA
jgi:predicted DNA-binding transcriptional regulator AlpA